MNRLIIIGNGFDFDHRIKLGLDIIHLVNYLSLH